MDRDTAIARLRTHEAELRGLGVVRLTLFGSTARNAASARSDVDVAVRLSDRYRGFAAVGALQKIERVLSRSFSAPVHVVPEPRLPGPFTVELDRDRCLAF